MKYVLLTLSALAVAACGNPMRTVSSGSDESGHANLSSSAGGGSPPTLQQVQSLTDTIAGVLTGFFVQIQGLTQVSLTPGSQSVFTDAHLACPSGGTLILSGHDTLSLNLYPPTLSGALSDGYGSITFGSCGLNVPGLGAVTINGSLALSAVQGLVQATVSIGAPDTFSAQGTGQVQGSLQITAASLNFNCSVVANDAFSARGSVSVVPASISGTASSQFSGSFCGRNVSQSGSFPFQI